MGSEAFLFRFENPSTKPRVLNGGPWYISNMPILLQNWTPGFSKEKLSTTKFPLWIVLHGVPMELFTKKGLAHIASAVGVPLYLDKSTELCRYVDIAKVCIEVKRENPLPSSIDVNVEGVGLLEIMVEYAWKPVVCSFCSGFGHSDQNCFGGG